MNNALKFPVFDDRLPDLDSFIHELVGEYKDGKLKSWDDLEIRVKSFFTPKRMDEMEAIVPHWRKMASFSDGVTLVHVMCVFMGLHVMPEFRDMTGDQQQIMKWVILFHDVEKEPQKGKRDHIHAFRSAVGAANTLPMLGFPVTQEYESLIDEWSEFTRNATIKLVDSSDDVQDNGKLPEILGGIERMFGNNTPAALIVKTILFHLSVDMNDWPPPNPLTEEEAIQYFDGELMPMLKVMHLADGDGWAMFKPEIRERQRMDTIEVFEKLEHLISG